MTISFSLAPPKNEGVFYCIEIDCKHYILLWRLENEVYKIYGFDRESKVWDSHLHLITYKWI